LAYYTIPVNLLSTKARKRGYRAGSYVKGISGRLEVRFILHLLDEKMYGQTL